MEINCTLFQEDHEIFRKQVRKFVEKEILPYVDRWEEEKYFPDELFRKAGEAGFFGILVPEEYGGSGGDAVYAAVLIEELVRCGSGGVQAGLGMHGLVFINALLNYASEEQKKKYLPLTVRGEKIGAVAVTEPYAGSDVFNIKTKAEKKDGYYLLNGSKIFITNGVRADLVIVLARTDPAGGYGGFTTFLVEKGMDGFKVARKIEKVGWWASDTAELVFEDVKVPFENVLGKEGDGFYNIMYGFDFERLVMALGAVAGAQYALEEGVKYAKERETFGRPIAKFQIWKHRFAELATLIEAARQLTYHGLCLYVKGESAIKELTMAKYFATEVSNLVTDYVLQVHGGYGYTMDFPAQRWWRDSRIGTIGGGTSEIMLEIISKILGL